MSSENAVRSRSGALRRGESASLRIAYLLLLASRPLHSVAAFFPPPPPPFGRSVRPRGSARALSASPEDSPAPLRLELSLPDGAAVAVELSSPKDAAAQARRVAEAHGGDPAALEATLRRCWEDAAAPPPPYRGPVGAAPPDSATTLPSGLVLEVAASAIPGAGRGVFVRRTGGDGPGVLQTAGSAFAGYGRCAEIVEDPSGIPAEVRGRAFEFRLEDGFASSVWCDGELTTVAEAMARHGVHRVVGHDVVADEDGGFALVPDEGGPRYLIPETEDPADTSVRTMGQFANDLAGGDAAGSEEEYDALSRERNLLVLVPNVILTEGETALGPAGMPVLTMARSVYVDNVDESMEVGCRYGYQYWK